MENCLFCTIINGDIPCDKIYEDEHAFAFLDIKPLNDGHTLVLPKEHHENMLSVPESTFLNVMRVAHMLAPIIQKTVGADGVNLGINNGSAAGQVIFHLHTHIIPRNTGDGYHPWKRADANPPKLKETQAKIIAALKK